MLSLLEKASSSLYYFSVYFEFGKKTVLSDALSLLTVSVTIHKTFAFTPLFLHLNFS